MPSGFLLITHDVGTASESEFQSWYQFEHLDERLGVPGFLTARRYISQASAQRYAAMYETLSPDVLRSPAYAALMGKPSEKTRAIMPHFKDVTRIIGRVAFKHDRGAGGAGAILFLDRPNATDDDAQSIGRIAMQARAAGLAPEAVRVVVVEHDNVGVDTPESRYRPTPDRKAHVALVVEWLQATSADVQELRTSLARAGWKVESDRGGLYRLLCARVREAVP
ncbi:MAG: hypothetical protein EXR36_05775 [Betaproteobacteria bacterium]|nr:hypothetical protein [Betaproteobacteria bacterium]